MLNDAVLVAASHCPNRPSCPPSFATFSQKSTVQSLEPSVKLPTVADRESLALVIQDMEAAMALVRAVLNR